MASLSLSSLSTQTSIQTWIWIITVTEVSNLQPRYKHYLPNQQLAPTHDDDDEAHCSKSRFEMSQKDLWLFCHTYHCSWLAWLQELQITFLRLSCKDVIRFTTFYCPYIVTWNTTGSCGIGYRTGSYNVVEVGQHWFVHQLAVVDEEHGRLIVYTHLQEYSFDLVI